MVKDVMPGKTGLPMMAVLYKVGVKVLEDGNQVRLNTIYILENIKTIKSQGKANTLGTTELCTKEIS
jgi:hypothetical protein